MNPTAISANNSINATLPDPTTRGPVLAAALGLAMARDALLPSSPVEDESNYFNMNALPTVRQKLSTFNENIIVDINATLQWTRAFWMIRYSAAHPRNYIMADASTVNFFESLVGADTMISQEQRNLLDLNRLAVFSLSCDLAVVLNEE
jgi:hypothetical protein